MIYDGWREYHEKWESQHKGLAHLGDEWGMDKHFRILVNSLVRPDYKILDIGCGGGKITSILAESGAHVVAADTCIDMLKRTKKRLPAVDTYCIESINWDFLDNTFDLVVSYDTFVHIESTDIFYYMGEISRVLKDTGRALLHLSNVDSPESFMHWVGSNAQHKLGSRHYYAFSMMTEELARKIFEHHHLEVELSQFVCGKRDKVYSLRPQMSWKI